MGIQFLNKKKTGISAGNLLRFLVVFAFTIQLIVITYNHLSGYYVLENTGHFLMRLLMGTLMSSVAALFLAYPDLFMIRYLNKRAPWNSRLIFRASVQLGFTLLIAIVVAILFTLGSNAIRPYKNELIGVMVNNVLIFCIVNFILATILEGWNYYIESKQARAEAQDLKKELSQIKFEVLKSQINPHFMFNSLNVLSGLIGKDTVKAQQFIDEFSHIYRYVLETIEKPVVSLSRELGFMRSYLFLQQIRYGKALRYEMRIPSEKLDLLLPPLSLQVVLENAIKHNSLDESKPLKIEVSYKDNFLQVKNNFQRKISLGRSTGLGLANLVNRYALITDKKAVFTLETKHYIAKLPLIKAN
ncbi:MAG: histidine kinase [Bacteroidales bacterium]|nr:histidine kinase [Bacteroidales bacterium]MCF8343295.1 histidine kinase [Bacteroidales bacterium]MCF8375529.1 histidine kinase [Bacteroidales bacterium]MCF8399928.1 histidine kinase [Bacteroidales bacterium]